MAKEWILNSAINRFQLNFKRNVGPTSESIRQCAPGTIDEYQEYYFSNVRPKEHIIELGRKLYIKIHEMNMEFHQTGWRHYRWWSIIVSQYFTIRS